MSIYRGAGGSGDAVNDASSEATLVQTLVNNATTQAADAATSATAAQAASTQAVISQGLAQDAATAAATAETNAETAETNAETGQAAAEAAQAAAETAQTAAELAETNAETAETNAETAQAAAATSATNASNSASAASTSATNASNSADAAATSATNAAASYDAFDDRYLGSKSSNPTVDNDGNALLTGALYFNTTVPEMRLYNGTNWIFIGSGAAAGVESFNTRTGAVTLTSSDVTTALTYTPLAPAAIGTTVQAYDADLTTLGAGGSSARSFLGLAIGTDVQAYDADTTKNDVANTFSANQIISVTDNSNAALRITQLGTGNALVVEDSTNPDSTPFVIDASGQVIKGYTTTVATGNDVGASFTPGTQIHAISSQGQSSLGLFNWINGATNESNLVFSHSRSGVIGTFGAVSSGDSLGAIAFAGDDGTAFITAAKIASEVDGTPGTNDMPGRLVFSTTADGASSPTERMRITSAGNVGIGTASPAVELEVSSATGSATPVPTEVRIATTTNASDWSITDPWGRLSFYSADTSGAGPKIHASIDVIQAGTSGSTSSISFKTNDSATNTLSERMLIRNSLSGAATTVELTNSTGLQIARTAVTSPATTDGNVFSGTYTPTLTNVTNVAASTAVICQYTRVGNVVTVSGTVNIDPTAASTLTVVRISLPIASAMTATTQLAGTCHGNWVVGVAGAGAMIADTTNDEALLRTIPPNDANAGYAFTFTYRIV